MDTCPECDGTGTLVLIGNNGQQVYRESFICTLCNGSGVITNFTHVQSDNLQEAALIKAVKRNA